MQNVCIFAASSPKLARHYIDAAFALGAALAENGIGLVFGGGRTGLMGACARGVQAKGGCITGVIPKKLNVPGIAFEHCDELIVTEDMHTRKATMERLSGAYIALPGGIGTLEELLEVLTLNQLGYLSAPVVIFNQNGYYDALIGQLRVCVEQEFADVSCLRLFAVADTPEEAVRALQAFELPELPNKIKDAIKYDKEAST